MSTHPSDATTSSSPSLSEAPKGHPGHPGTSPSPTTSALPQPPDEAALEQFKNDVRMWLELDASIRQLQTSLRDRKKARNVLHERIMRFMGQHNIEDLNTRECRLRYKISYVRSSLSQQAIKERIQSFFNNTAVAQALQAAIFGVRERQERHSLLRLQPRGT